MCIALNEISSRLAISTSNEMQVRPCGRKGGALANNRQVKSSNSNNSSLYRNCSYTRARRRSTRFTKFRYRNSTFLLLRFLSKLVNCKCETKPRNPQVIYLTMWTEGHNCQ